MRTLAFLQLTLAPKKSQQSSLLSVINWRKFSAQIARQVLVLVGSFTVLVAAGDALALQFGTSALQFGDSGFDVENLQSSLTTAGFYNGPITGFYGELTTDAVTRFQQTRGLQVDGIAGPETLAALSGQRAPVAVGRTFQPPVLPVPPDPLPISSSAGVIPVTSTAAVSTDGTVRPLFPGDRGPEVENLQTRLREEGFDPGPIDGAFGDQTSLAVQAFQFDQGLSATGFADAETLRALGLEDRPEDRNPFVVAVPGRSTALLNRVREVEPTATSDRIRRGSFINAGAFPSRALAESRSFFLRSRGLDARVIRR
ncbi:MAG: hypothetical protein F6K19_26150 [Cyanothece sp. SIO1E1]|nr:hypothetical protein [Cyanothece sp. SIO1E1]